MNPFCRTYPIIVASKVKLDSSSCVGSMKEGGEEIFKKS
jgi:hypothetical protein